MNPRHCGYYSDSIKTEEDNAGAHMQRHLMGRTVVVPVAEGQPDSGGEGIDFLGRVGWVTAKEGAGEDRWGVARANAVPRTVEQNKQYDQMRGKATHPVIIQTRLKAERGGA